jgi:hypothetical protein
MLFMLQAQLAKPAGMSNKEFYGDLAAGSRSGGRRAKRPKPNKDVTRGNKGLCDAKT